MKIPESFKNMSSVELVLFLAFVLYIILPMDTPVWMKPFVNSAMGMVFFFCVTVGLFAYTNPILGVLYILVVYEVLRRSSETAKNPRAIVLEYEPSQATKNAALRKMNPERTEKTVEEEVIAARAPINREHSVDIVQTTFKPVSKPIEGASSYK
jgi:predicted membrane protein